MRFPAFPRLHRSTFVLAAVSLAVGIVANLGGDYHPPDVITEVDSISFGWPCAYGQAVSREGISPVRLSDLSLWDQRQINKWHFGALLLDLFVLLAIVVALAAIWEWRRRKIKHLLQFTLADVFLGSLLVAGFYGFERYLCRDMFAEREIRLTYDQPWRLDGQKMGIAEGLYSINQDVPADWFWELFRVPNTHRPYRRLRLLLIGDKGSLQLSPKQEELLGRLRNLRELELICTLSDGQAIMNLRQLQTLKVAFPNDQVLTALPPLPNLQQLTLRSGKFTDVGLLSLSRQPELRNLTILECEIQGGAAFERLQKVEKLRLLKVSMGHAGMDGVGRIPLLEEVEFQICLPTEESSFDWGSLAQCQKLRKILIRSQIVDWSTGNYSVTSTTDYLNDSALKKFATLPNLEDLVFLSNALTDADVACLAEAPHLRTLHIHSPGGCLTDETLYLFAKKQHSTQIYFRCGSFSDEAMQHFREALPHCSVSQ